MENQKRGGREGGGPPRRSVQSNPVLPVHPISSRVIDFYQEERIWGWGRCVKPEQGYKEVHTYTLARYRSEQEGFYEPDVKSWSDYMVVCR